MARSETAGGATNEPPPVVPARWVGRERELAALAAGLHRRAPVLLVEGEAGIGKSRVVAEALAGQVRLRYVIGRCLPVREPYTLGPVVDALRSAGPVAGLSPLGGALQPVFPEWAERLPAGLEPLADALAARHRLFRALVELLCRLGVDVVVVEDVQWADDATAEFLLFLVSIREQAMGDGAAATVSPSVVATYRPEEVPAGSLVRRLWLRPDQVRVVLGELDVATTGALVSSMLGGAPVSAGFAAVLHRQTAGIPYVVEESVRLLAERSVLVYRRGGWRRRALEGIAVPARVRDAVVERAGRLPVDARSVLDAAAVLGEPAEESLVAAVAGLPAERGAAGLAAALRSGLLREDAAGLVSVRHDLAAQAVYATLDRAVRRELHRRAGRALEAVTPAPMARLARHFRAAGDRDAWCRYAEAAADVALGAGDESAAAALLCDLVTGAEPAADVLVRMLDRIPSGPVFGSRRCSEMATALRSVLAGGSLTPDVEGAVRFHLACLLNLVGNHPAARPEYVAAAELLTHDRTLALRATLAVVEPRGEPAWPVAEHLRWLRRADALAEGLTGHLALRFAARRTTMLLMLGEGEGWELAAALPEVAMDPSERAVVVSAQINLGDVAVQWGRYREARKWTHHALELAGRYGYPVVRLLAENNLVHLDYLTGQWDGLAERAGELAVDLQHSTLTNPTLRLVTGALHAACGRGPALRELADATAMAESAGAYDLYTQGVALQARVHLATGLVGEALGVTDDAVAIVRRKGMWLWASELAPVRVQALLAAGRDGAAADLVAAFETGRGGRDAPAPHAGLLLCRALLSDHAGSSSAAEDYARAAAAWDDLPSPYEALRVRVRQAACLFAAGGTEPATALLLQAVSDLRGLGATADAAEADALLRRHGVALRRGRRGYGDELSPRELEVVRLVVSGRTNREIAAALSRSTQTVTTQLKSAMRKLGMSSRTALAVAAVEAGLVDDEQPPVG